MILQAVYPVTARLTKAQGEALQRAAALTGLSVSALIRQAVEQAYVQPDQHDRRQGAKS
jgi:uncharacterized protein (DUF1778 family)